MKDLKLCKMGNEMIDWEAIFIPLAQVKRNKSKWSREASDVQWASSAGNGVSGLVIPTPSSDILTNAESCPSCLCASEMFQRGACLANLNGGACAIPPSGDTFLSWGQAQGLPYRNSITAGGFIQIHLHLLFQHLWGIYLEQYQESKAVLWGVHMETFRSDQRTSGAPRRGITALSFPSSCSPLFYIVANIACVLL